MAMYPVKKLFLCVCAASLYMCGTDAAAHRDRCHPFNYGLLPPLCGIIRWTVVSPDRGLSFSLAHITRVGRGCWERGGRGGKCDSDLVRMCTSAYVRLCECVVCECTVAMSHTVWGQQCICAQHDKCVPLDSISSLESYSIWCQLCTLWYNACFVSLRDEWDVRNSVAGCFIDIVLWPVPWRQGCQFKTVQRINRRSVTQRENVIFLSGWARDVPYKCM